MRYRPGALAVVGSNPTGPKYVHGFIYLSSVIYDMIEPESEV